MGRNTQTNINRRTVIKGSAAVAASAAGAASLAMPALAQAAVEIPFFYPVAVGGPITKLIDTFAADFQKENPGITLKPIYA